MAVKSILGSLLFEEKPDLPALRLPTLAESQMASIEGNLGVLPRQKGLARQVDAFNQERLMEAYRAAVPGFEDIVGRTSANIQAGLRGEIPQDVADRVFDITAAKALGGGYGIGSGFRGSDFARQLGLTSYDITQRSIDSATRWLAFGHQALIAPQMDLTSAFVTPAAQHQADTERAIRLWNYDWFKSQHEAQPEPWEAAVQGLMDWVANTSLSVAGSYLGNIGGMMGGVGGSGSAPSGNLTPGYVGRTGGAEYFDVP